MATFRAHRRGAIWEAAGRITDTGYVIEVAIPFNQLRFPKGGAALTWGFEADRSYPRSVRHRLSTHRRDRNRNCLICQFDAIRGFEGISPGRNVQLTPTLTMDRTDRREDLPAGPMAQDHLRRLRLASNVRYAAISVSRR